MHQKLPPLVIINMTRSSVINFNFFKSCAGGGAFETPWCHWHQLNLSIQLIFSSNRNLLMNGVGLGQYQGLTLIFFNYVYSKQI